MPGTSPAAAHAFRVEKSRRACGPGCELVVSVCPCGISKRERVLDGEVVTTEVKLRETWPWIDSRDLAVITADLLAHAGVAEAAG